MLADDLSKELECYHCEEEHEILRHGGTFWVNCDGDYYLVGAFLDDDENAIVYLRPPWSATDESYVMTRA